MLKLERELECERLPLPLGHPGAECRERDSNPHFSPRFRLSFSFSLRSSRIPPRDGGGSLAGYPSNR
jgi:hypothetical protein